MTEAIFFSAFVSANDFWTSANRSNDKSKTRGLKDQEWINRYDK